MSFPVGSRQKPPQEDLVWDEWVDAIGQTYRPGDIVAVAIINDRSPQQVIGEVIQINKMRHTDGHYLDDDGLRRYGKVWLPITARAMVEGPDPTDERWANSDYHWEQVPSCTVRIQPLIDSRGFGRWSSRDRSKPWWQDRGLHFNDSTKPTTYQLPKNIIKLPVTRQELEERFR